MEKRDQQRKRQHAVRDHIGSATSQQPKPASAKEDNAKRRYPTEDEHRFAEQRHWRLQIGLGVATLLFAAMATAGAIWTYFETARQGRTSQSSLLTSQSAYIVVSELEKTASQRGVGFFRLTPKIRNSGTTPALGVEITNLVPTNEWMRHFPPRDRHLDDFVDWKVGAPMDPQQASNQDELSRVPTLVIGGGSTLTASKLAAELPDSAGMDAQTGKVGRFFLRHD